MKTQTIFFILLNILLTGTFSCAESQNQSGAAAPVEESDSANIIIKEEFAKLNCEEARFVKLINLYRKSLKLSELKVAFRGVEAARWHGLDMGKNSYFAHTEPNGRTAFERMDYFNYPGQAENIAAGYATGDKVFCVWKKSAGHDKNMRGAKWTTVSIGLANVQGSRYKNYWNSGFSSKPVEVVAEPLTMAASCSMPTTLPICS